MRPPFQLWFFLRHYLVRSRTLGLGSGVYSYTTIRYLFIIISTNVLSYDSTYNCVDSLARS